MKILALLCVLAAAAASGAEGKKSASAPCSAPEYRQFDFFTGNWDVFDFGADSKVKARLRVAKILDGCVIHEDYKSVEAGGLHGESFSLYDAPSRRWHQSWVTNRGELILLDGGLEGGRMVLTGAVTGAAGGKSLLRGTWIPGPGSVRETAVASADGGRTWTPAFDIVLRPHTGASRP